jgi:hypothetical protein
MGEKKNQHVKLKKKSLKKYEIKISPVISYSFFFFAAIFLAQFFFFFALQETTK